MTPREKIAAILVLLSEEYPDAKTELSFSNPFETLIATMLSAQCTDKRVNEVTKDLFKIAPDPRAMSKLAQDDLEKMIKVCGLYRSKAKHILEACNELNSLYDGTVPNNKKALTSLPGVGGKTASVVMMEAFGADLLPVDTHVFRLAHRLELVEDAKTPDETQAQLEAITPSGEKRHMHHLLILHGRRRCKAISPDCEHCPLKGSVCRFERNKKS
ncbi:MAG: endonuclease III [Clostridiales bacterium]|nr:endonuclease III [Clostridiales bacterium]